MGVDIFQYIKFCSTQRKAHNFTINTEALKIGELKLRKTKNYTTSFQQSQSPLLKYVAILSELLTWLA